MKRNYYQSAELRLSYLDFEGGDKPILLCLHGHFGNAAMFARLAEKLPNWHVYSLDQRGHGWSQHAKREDYQREDYVRDILTFMEHVLQNKPVVLLGHSLGGVNAYQAAARLKQRVRGLIIEDIGAVIDDDLSFASSIMEPMPTLHALGEGLKAVGIDDDNYFIESAYENENGWNFRFDKKNIPFSQNYLNGAWWDDFLATDCPTLLLHGKLSHVVSDEQIIEMAKKRKHTAYQFFEKSGHTIHDDEPLAFCKAVAAFLKQFQA
ncbi:alpha/beta fold hydrolase [Sporolactobacillus laevolacticus]|uniref:alpha/beta fold hydrolase n=1 Tax=Sporolactobacillus laevolacticus TaxID=33018 RepID=UPI0025B4D725|nr:alpha/beta hydrolase [Sporolactobacillus laevolacticus]MDN3954498.1 alpha/beta hydrolase [Sporolactobacillus laevolacticus]